MGLGSGRPKLACGRQKPLLDPIRYGVAIGQFLPISIKKPCALGSWDEQQLQGLGRPVDFKLRDRLAHGRGAVDHISDELTLGRQTINLGIDEAAPHLVQHQRPADQDGEAQKVQGDDQAAKARARNQLSPPLAGSLTLPRPEPRFSRGPGGRFRIRDICIQRHRGFLSHQRSDRPDEICVSSA